MPDLTLTYFVFRPIFQRAVTPVAKNPLIAFLFFNQGLRVSGVKLQVASLNGTNGRQRDNRIITAKSFLSLHELGSKL